MSSSERALSSARQGLGLGARVAVAGGALLLEKAFLNLFVDFASAQNAQGLGAVVRTTQHWGFRLLVSFAIAAALFSYLRGGRELRQADVAARAEPVVRWRWLLAHLGLVVLLVPVSASLYDHASLLPFGGVAALWLLLAILAAAALFAALAPWALWQRAVRALGSSWWYGGIAAAGAVLAMGWNEQLWTGMARTTFEAVYRLVSLFVPNLQVDPENLVIDTGRFAVVIAPVCSGVEGMGLMLAFCIVLLLLFRREYIFPRAFLLVPAGLLLSFALNLARIATLVLIGNGGFTSVAIYGFHSQAGWIAFNAAAVGIALVSLRSPWFSRAAPARTAATAAENPTAVYLLPYLALILAGMVSKAASGGFESLYWLRLLAAAAALGYSLPRLQGVDWRFSWRGVASGVAAFGLWVMIARIVRPPQAVPTALAALPPTWQAAWVIGHSLASVAVTPLVEELAFRGYLMRRIRSVDFQTVLPRAAGGQALIISAVVFGLCQGVFWMPGMITGVIFGLLYMRTGRLGEAVSAHVTGNALIAAVVLGGSQWQLW